MLRQRPFFGTPNRVPLGIILDFEKLKGWFKKEFDRIINPPTKVKLKAYAPLLIDLTGLDIDLLPVKQNR